MADLRGKRVSLDEPGSGTLVDARLILAAYGLSEKDLKAEYLPAQQVADALKEGAIDAFFNVSGWPQSAVADLAATVGIELVPIDASAGERLGRDVVHSPTARRITAAAVVKAMRARRETDMRSSERAACPRSWKRRSTPAKPCSSTAPRGTASR